MALPGFPERIVCLTEETTETLYRLGEGDRVVGISGYTVRPPEARSKPKVSAFINARFDKIEALRPDLVLAFSDLQADITAELIRRGLPVFTFNQRSVAEILQMVRMLGGIVGCVERADALANELAMGLETARRAAEAFPFRPRVFFEEWDDPLISGIRWVDELIDIAGGAPLFPELRTEGLATNRVVRPAEVAARNPELIIASWCGKAVRKTTIKTRPDWHKTAAVQHGHVYEIKSTYILQPGPAALTEGLRQLHQLIAHTVGATPSPSLACEQPTDLPAASLDGTSTTDDHADTEVISWKVVTPRMRPVQQVCAAIAATSAASRATTGTSITCAGCLPLIPDT